MRVTVAIEDELVEAAMEATGIKYKSELFHAGLVYLVQREAARRLIALGGSAPDAKAAPRRRPEVKAPRNSPKRTTL